ncbi:MAG: hypothetical protein ACOX7F_06540 [Eubacteriales bacterium]|jgi:hypothetical protein
MKKPRVRLGRGMRTVRNLLLALLLLLPLWAAAWYPLPTMEMHFHRMERRELLPESQLVLEYTDARGCHMVGEGEEHWVVATLTDRALIGEDLRIYPRQEEVAVLPLPSESIDSENGSFAIRPALAVVGLPPETDWIEAKLEVDLDRPVQRHKTWWVNGIDCGEGSFILRLPEAELNQEEMVRFRRGELPVTCTLTASAGEETVLEWSGTSSSPS